MSDWLERQLTEHLAKVRAPESLWDRLQHPRPQPASTAPWLRWPVAAILTMATTAGTFWLSAQAPPDPHRQLLRATHQSEPVPSNWSLHCTLSAGGSVVQLASFSLEGHAPAGPAFLREESSCYQCHSTVSN